MNMPSPEHPDFLPTRRRNRTMLVAIVVIFLGSALVAGLLRFSGWRPHGSRNHGELLQPPGDLRTVAPGLMDGGEYAWNPIDRTWRILVAPPASCTDACVRLSHDLDTVWRLFGRDADDVHVLWVDTPPAGVERNRAWRVLEPSASLSAALPGVDAGGAAGVPVYVVDPNGFVILRYAPGFDAGHLRQDLARLLKLK
jgi:cytochrome oxidase Cu insertion factor (SCO1/SenC/PrrC family)